MDDYEKCYNEFWKELVESDGVVDMDQIKKELFDYVNVIKNCVTVYMGVTGGKVSKLDTDPSVVISLAQEYFSEGE